MTIAIAVLEALDAAPLPHLSLRPTSIFLRGDGTVAVADLAFAGALADPKNTRSGPLPSHEHIMYMSPEQAMNRPEIDRRADLYTVGACLHAMLAGRDPYPRPENVMMLLVAIIQNAPEPLDASPALATVVLRAMHKDPAQRYPSARAMIDALRTTT
ncbi:MAG: protein kinase, partial [Deltaproteobacteria bacterium]|nr:protein kinase [Deltaproteobacteria bacterium]